MRHQLCHIPLVKSFYSLPLQQFRSYLPQCYCFLSLRCVDQSVTGQNYFQGVQKGSCDSRRNQCVEQEPVGVWSSIIANELEDLELDASVDGFTEDVDLGREKEASESFFAMYLPDTGRERSIGVLR